MKIDLENPDIQKFLMLSRPSAKYSVNAENGKLDVDGSFNISDMTITSGKLPIAFNIVKGDFYVSNCNLKTLENAPEVVVGDFDCSYNKLKSIKHCPKGIKGTFNCEYNDIEYLEDFPEFLADDFLISGNNNLKELPAFKTSKIHHESYNTDRKRFFEMLKIGWINAISKDSSKVISCPVDILKEINPKIGKIKDIGMFEHLKNFKNFIQ